MARGILTALLMAAVLALVAGHGGALHAAGDSLAVFRLQIAAAGLAVALGLMLLGRWRAGRIAVAVIAVLSATAVAGYLPTPGAPPPGAWALYQKNLLFRLPALDPVARDIRESRADFVTLQEVSARNLPLLEMLAQDYPGQLRCRFRRVGGPAVLSRFPALPGQALCAEAGGLAALRVATPQGPLWVVSVHLHWPWPHGQAAQVARLLPVLKGLEPPVILGGDFNMVPWGASVRSIATAAGARVAGPTAASFDLFGGAVPLPIDQVLLPEGWRGWKTLRPELGSDHRAVLVQFAAPGTAAPRD